MFNIGPIELLFLLGSPVAGLVTAIYLSVALRNNARRAQERR